MKEITYSCWSGKQTGEHQSKTTKENIAYIATQSIAKLDYNEIHEVSWYFYEGSLEHKFQISRYLPLVFPRDAHRLSDS